MLQDVFWELVEAFKAAPAEWKAIAFLVGLCLLALGSFLVALTASKAAGPFRDIPAPKGYPDGHPDNPPSWLSVDKRLTYEMQCLYVGKCAHNGIGWFAPRILLWMASLGVTCCIARQLLSTIGLPTMPEKYFAIGFALLQFEALIIAYFHNAGRRAGAKPPKKPVPVQTFLQIFFLPICMTTAVVAFEFYKHHLFSIAKMAWDMIPSTPIG